MRIQILCTILFICIAQILSAQDLELDARKLAAELNDKSYEKAETVRMLATTLEKVDSTRAFRFLDELAQADDPKTYHFQARLNCLRAAQIYFRNFYQIYQHRKLADSDPLKKEIGALLSSAMDLAYRSEDDYLVAFVSLWNAGLIVRIGDVGQAVMYTKNGIDLYEQLSYPIRPEQYQFLAELLYKVREYDECVRYGRKGVTAWQNSPDEIKSFTINTTNTVALGYHRQGIYDSAFIFYNQALQLARQTKNTVWVGIVSGNIGQILYTQGNYDSAYGLFTMDYEASKAAGFYDNAANSLQWAARTSLARGHKTTALQQAREALQLLRLWPDAGYLRNTYYTFTQVFRQMGAYDSVFYYNNLYSAVHDSLEKVVATSSLAIAKARLTDERSRYQIQSLNKEKRAQLVLRNIMIAAILAFSLIVILIVNRKRLKERLKTEKAEQEKLRMEQEMASAKEQMRMFTENIIEKTSLIEKLEGQAKDRRVSSEHQAIISELTHQTILTEEDWTQFKSLFETIYPAFFLKLKNKFPDITLAEQRMAALTRLQLTTKQIASMLGISVDSVHKSRQRLRQRFQVGTEANLEEMVASL